MISLHRKIPKPSRHGEIQRDFGFRDGTRKVVPLKHEERSRLRIESFSAALIWKYGPICWTTQAVYALRDGPLNRRLPLSKNARIAETYCGAIGKLLMASHQINDPAIEFGHL